MNAARFAATAVETSAIALWVGSSAGFAFIFAPIAFHLIADRNVFAELTERSLGRLAALAYAAGGLAAGVALMRAGFERERRLNDLSRGLLALSAIGCISYHQTQIVPTMTAAQIAMGGFADVAEDDPKRVAYRALHKQSTRVFGTALLFGIAQLVLTSTRACPSE